MRGSGPEDTDAVDDCTLPLLPALCASVSPCIYEFILGTRLVVFVLRYQHFRGTSM
jgi:hypothetical protein